MIRVGVFPADRGGCGMYRMVWPARAVRDEGLEVLVDGDVDLSKRIMLAWDRPFPEETGEALEWNTPVQLVNDPELDVVVFQRPLHSKYVATFRLLKEAGITVVVDADDNFDRIDPANVAWHAAQEHWVHEKELQAYVKEYGSVRVTRRTSHGWRYIPDHLGTLNKVHWRRALREADLVTCSTQALADHIRPTNPNVVVIDNYVPERYLEEPQPDNDPLVVGWTGSLQTHPRDLDQIGAGLAAVRRHVDFDLNVVGTGVGVGEALGVVHEHATGWVDVEEYATHYAKFDVALCPLNDSAFNRAKSRLKGVEAAAVGAVPVMSPLPEYARLNAAGVGLIARRPREWTSHVRRLLTDHSFREDLRHAGYDVARRNTVEGNAWRWAEAWTEARVRGPVRNVG